MYVLQEIAPELVIADINFFGAGIIKKISQITERFPDIKFIMYGTINDAGYLQKLTEYGVIDYMYRPVKPAEFNRCMENATAYFEKLNAKKRAEEQITENYRSQLHLYENKFLTTLVNGKIISETEIKRGLSYFGMDFPGGYNVFITRIDRFKKIILTLDEAEKHLMSFKICEIINAGLKKHIQNARAFVYEFNSVATLVGEEIEFGEMMAACDFIKNEIFKNAKIRVTIGLGRYYKNAADIRVSFNEADAALRYRFYLGHNTVIPIDFADPMNKITYRYPAIKEKQLVYSAVCGDYKYCETLLNDIFGALKKSGEIPDKLIPKIVADIMISISRYVSEQKLMQETKLAAFFKISEALRLKTPDEALDYLKTALNGFVGYINELKNINDKKLLQKTKDYIAERFNEETQLAKVALRLNATPEHINKLFSADGPTYHEYVALTRLNESKRLIKETDLSDEQIALKVGYSEVRHFRGLFKQQFGMLPQDLRNFERGRH